MPLPRNENKHPSAIAREALKLLTTRKLQPTPVNFQSCYNEIAGLPDQAPFPDQALRQVVGVLQTGNAQQENALRLLGEAIDGRNWRGMQEALLAFVAAFPGGDVRETKVLEVLPPLLAQKLALFVESVLPALVDGDEHLVLVATELLQSLRQPVVEITGVQGCLSSFAQLVSFAAEEQQEIRNSLHELLQLIIENIGDLSLDDSWLKGQIDGLLTAVAPPLTLRRLDETGRRLRDVMARQHEAKSRALEVQEEMRQMLGAFIERLAGMNASSEVFQQKIEESARQIEKVRHLEDLAPLLQDVIVATRAMAEESSSSREQLKSLQDKVLVTEAELAALHRELESASALARHDPLTDILNRKGLDEALAREIAGMRRKGQPLSLCLLDIDNFKKLNDQLGHAVGDEALIHFVNVARNCMRPSDSLARYGGEEFVVLMPDTLLDQGVEAMVRLQRELTKAFFLAGTDKLLITFSAGVSQLAPDESGESALDRADRAMYLAKRAGKNRVMAG